MPTINDLRQQAATIKNATQVGENTATRVGTTFETIADLLEGMGGVTNLSTIDIGSIDTLNTTGDMLVGTPNIYTITKTIGANTFKVGTLFQFANNGRYDVAQVIVSQFIVDADGRIDTTSADQEVHIFYRLCKTMNGGSLPTPIGTWTTWTELGGSGGSGVTIDPYPTQNSGNAVSSGGVFERLQDVAPKVDISAIDDIDEYTDMLAGVSPFYVVTKTLSGNVFRIGTLMEFANQGRYILYQILATDYVLNDDGTLDTTLSENGGLKLIWRMKQFSGNPPAGVTIGVWSAWSYLSGGDSGYQPDNEDIDLNASDQLQFANKSYDANAFSGLGRVYLRKNIVTSGGVEKNVLTQAMVNTANTIYHIQYDYDLNGQTITLPAGCVLEFEGGSLANGSIVGDFFVVGDNVAQMGVFPNGYNLSGDDEMLVAEKIGMIPNDVQKATYNAGILDNIITKKKGLIFCDAYYIGETTEQVDYSLELRGGEVYFQGNIFFELIAGASLHFENVVFHGIQDLSNSVRCNIVRDETFALLLDKIEFIGCSFDAIAPVYIKAIDNDYSLTQIGIKNFLVKDCNIKNTHRNIFTFYDVVFSESFVAIGNTITELCGVCFDLTRTNEFVDNTAYQSDVIVYNNIFTGFANDYDSYITPLLAETNRVFYRGNIVENIIGCHYNAYPYDAYVSSKEYHCEGNKFINIGKIIPDAETIPSDMAYPEIFKSKGGGGMRIAKNNSWEIDFSVIRSIAASTGVVVTDARFAECNKIDIFKPTSQLDSLVFSENKVTITNGRLGYPTSRIMAYEIQINDNMFVVDGAEGTAFVVVADNSTLINILRNYIYAKSNIFHVVKEVANSSTAQVIVKNNIIYPYMPTNLCVDFQKLICEENICLGFPSAVSQGTLNLYKQKSDSVVESYLSANDVNIRSVDNTKHRIFFNKTSGSISFNVKTNCFIECQSDKGNFKLRIVNDAMYDEWGNQIALTSSYYGFLNDVSIRKANSLDYTISISNAPKGIITFSDLKYYGGELQRTNRNYGEYEFDIDNTRPKWWCKGKYVNALGNDASAATSGASTSRPSSSLITAGFQYYDTTIGKPVWWNGSSWVDATGAAV